MRLYLIRHSDPEYPNNTITKFGHKKAEALAVRLAGVLEGVTGQLRRQGVRATGPP